LRIFQLVNLKKGFSLPLWVAASAQASLKKLLMLPFEDYELVKLPGSNKSEKLKVHSSGFLKDKEHALAITFANSELSLDITQNLEIWTLVSLEKLVFDKNSKSLINIIPGYGVGINSKTLEICISRFALELLEENLLDLIPSGYKLNLEIIFPKGKFLAERTSNKSFGIVEGLSIIGTTAEAYMSASSDQINNAKLELEKFTSKGINKIVFVIGENGLDLAKNMKLDFPVIKVGNWIGPLLVHAALKNVRRVILFGYHGKLIKLAGGIFHTHHHLADARIEILVYLALKANIPIELIHQISNSNTIEDALINLEKVDIEHTQNLWLLIANTIELRSLQYIKRYTSNELKVGAALFDRKRSVRWVGINAESMFLKPDNF